MPVKPQLTEKIAVLCTSRSEEWAKEKAQKLMAAATRNPFRKAPISKPFI